MKNSGFKILGEPSRKQGAVAIIVVGLNRGGTSAVAASLDALGIHLGDSCHKPIYEDLELARAFRAGKWKDLKTRISAYESEHERFAWKLPSIQNHLDRIHQCFQNPRYIFVYRDILAIALRREGVHQTEALDSMTRCLNGYAAVLKFIKKKQPHSLLVSYEKLVQEKSRFAEVLCDFCGIPASGENVAAVINRINPSPGDYLQWAETSAKEKELRQAGFAGTVDGLNLRSVSGWALKQHHGDPASVEVFVNGCFAGSVLADLFRQDLIEAGVSTNGRAGFSFAFCDPPPAPGDVVSVRIGGTAHDLINSPNSVH